MHRVTKAKALGGARLHVEFDDGVVGEIDLTERLYGPMFEPLRDESLFRQVSIDDFGVICWPNGADLAPDALHRKLSEEHPTTTDRQAR